VSPLAVDRRRARWGGDSAEADRHPMTPATFADFLGDPRGLRGAREARRREERATETAIKKSRGQSAGNMGKRHSACECAALPHSPEAGVSWAVVEMLA